MKHLTFRVDEETYERFWRMKNDQHPEPGHAITHEDALDLLLDRFEGQRRERPAVLRGSKARVDTPDGRVYVGVNADATGRPFEVFITVGSSGGYTKSWAEALAKTTSNALRAGADPEVVAEDLMGIRGPSVSIDNGDDIYSIPDAVGVVLKRFLDGKLDPPQAVRDGDDGPLTVHD